MKYDPLFVRIVIFWNFVASLVTNTLLFINHKGMFITEYIDTGLFLSLHMKKLNL